MSISVNYRSADTTIESYSQKNLPIGALNFVSDWKLRQTNKVNEAFYSKLSSTLDRPEVLRISWSEIPDIYKGTQIQDRVKGPSTKGIKLYIQLREIASVTDSTSADFRIDFPLESHLVLTIPANGYVTEAALVAHLGRLVSALFPTGSDATTQLAALIRGSLSLI